MNRGGYSVVLYVSYYRVRGHKGMKKLEEYVRSIPDFPEKGIIFRDVTSVLQDAEDRKSVV